MLSCFLYVKYSCGRRMTGFCCCFCVFVCLVCWFWSACFSLIISYYFFFIIPFYIGTVSSLVRKGLHWNHNRQRSVNQDPVAIKLLLCLYLLHLHDYAGSQQLSYVYWFLQLNTWRSCSRDIHVAKHLGGVQEQNIQTLLLQEARCFDLLCLIPVYQRQKYSYLSRCLMIGFEVLWSKSFLSLHAQQSLFGLLIINARQIVSVSIKSNHFW